MKSLIFILSILCSFSKLSHAQETTTDYGLAQQQILDILRTRDEWIFACFSKQGEETGLLGAAGVVPFRMKKWKVEASKLREITLTSVIKDSTDNQIWTSLSADLTQNLPLTIWFDAEPKDVKFKRLSKHSFVLEGDSFMTVVFPARKNPFSSNLFVDFKHMNAPVALDIGLRGSIFPPPAKATTVLRHDLASKRPVFVTKAFPIKFLPALKNSLAKWNQVLGSNFYYYGGVLKNDLSKCVSQGWLCIVWKGAEQLPWAGLGGISSVSYDPETGLILGGYIGLYNSNKDKILPEPDSKTVRAVEEGNSNAIARLMLSREKMMDVANPFPEENVESILLHELGHDNGLNHYFMGSLHPSNGQYSDTVMDYMPFPLFHTMLQLGPRDVAKIRKIYFGGNEIHETPCSDNQVMSSPFCKPGDVGSTEEWLMRLAEEGQDSLTTQFRFLGGLSLMFGKPSPIFKYFAGFMLPEIPKPQIPDNLPPEEKEKLEKEIEKHMAEVEKQLAKYLPGVTRQISNKVKAFLCEPKHLSQIKEYLSKNPTEEFQLNCSAQ